ncbi:hypothetical protein GALL_157740 [mine drainage metagenome]|uniref:Peptidase S1 domain-containing protein n=1 Tax=mine drainage metagenome TaxID=410659 RepID=A0A1J5S2C6_9ZZZZ
MNISPAELEKATSAISACIPELIAKSTIGIVAANAPYIGLLGTGTLLAVAEHRFIVTAAHVIKEVSGRSVGIMGSSKGNFVPLAGNWFLSSAESSVFSNDPYDVAVYELNEQECSRLLEVEFVRIRDVEFNTDLSSSFFLISGFPKVWSTSIDETQETMHARLLQYGTCALENAVGLQNYDSQLHILLKASPEELFDHTGKEAKFRMRTNYPAQMPDDLRGVSGCSVWKIGDIKKPIESWGRDECRLVGIETSIYSKPGAVKATRWNAVATLLYEAVPAIRPVIKMYENQLM